MELLAGEGCYGFTLELLISKFLLKSIACIDLLLLYYVLKAELKSKYCIIVFYCKNCIN